MEQLLIDSWKLKNQLFKHKLTVNEMFNFPNVSTNAELNMIKKSKEDLQRLLEDIQVGGLDLLPHYITYLLEERRKQIV